MRISDWSSDVCSSDLLLRTEMWPVWIGLPLGLVDDLFSGAPIGTAVCLWTLASIAIHYFAQRIYWRGFRSEEQTSELQSLMRISYAVFCLKKKKTIKQHPNKLHQTQLQ